MTATPARAATESNSAQSTARSAGRLAAVQALYQIDATEGAPDQVIKDFLTGRTGSVVMTEDPVTAQESLQALPELDSEIFIALVRAVQNRGDEIDDMIRGALSPEWPWYRIELTLKAGLSAAVA